MKFDSFNLPQLGWDGFLAACFQPYAADGSSPGRVALEHKGFYRVYAEAGEVLAEVTGKLRHEAASREDLPAVGDWVVLRARPGEGRATIHGVLPRRSKFIRKAAGQRAEEQIVAANVDTVFLMTSLNNDYNLRRLERYLALAWESGARPVIVLSKADLCPDVTTPMAEVQAAARGVPIHAVSVVSSQGLDDLAQYMGFGQTAAFLGSSGVGKSTLINSLVGQQLQRVQDVRSGDDRGRHTTSHRELIVLPRGGLVLDTPGMRELQLWDAAEGVQGVFADVESLAGRCRFRNCRHEGEPGCAVQEALADGALDEARYQNYEKLRKELAHLALRRDHNAQMVEKKKLKRLMRMGRERSHFKRGGR